jgi:hypothetical protein
MQFNLLWNIELPEPHEFWGFQAREFELSNTGSFMAVTDFHKLHIISTYDGSQIGQFVFDEHISNTEFSESDSNIAFSCFTHHETTPLRPINSFGARTISLQNESYELNSHFQAANSLSEPGMPDILKCYSISNSAYLLGILSYNSPRNFARLTLLSPVGKIVWLSDRISQGSSRFIDSYGEFRNDNSGFWYFDGTSMHSCMIEEI